MNIQTVAENLRNTIADKESMLDKLIQRKDVNREFHDEVAYFSTVEFLKISISELKRILQDVEQSVVDYDELKDDLKEANSRVRQLELQASNDTLDGPMIKMFRED